MNLFVRQFQSIRVSRLGQFSDWIYPQSPHTQLARKAVRTQKRAFVLPGILLAWGLLVCYYFARAGVHHRSNRS
jgi:hypothetical protein